VEAFERLMLLFTVEALFFIILGVDNLESIFFQNDFPTKTISMKYLFALVLVFSLVGCASINVNYDYDKQTVFSAYTTYNYYPDMNTGMNELDVKRLLDAIDSYMQTKGSYLRRSPISISILKVPCTDLPVTAVLVLGSEEEAVP